MYKCPACLAVDHNAKTDSGKAIADKQAEQAQENQFLGESLDISFYDEFFGGLEASDCDCILRYSAHKRVQGKSKPM